MKPYVQDADFTLYHGDALEVLRDLAAESVHCCVSSPPYWSLRDYGVAGQLGLEPTPEEYVARMVEVFREVRRVLRSDGTCWLNLGDSYVSTAQGTADHPQRMNGMADDHRGSQRTRPAVANLKPKDLVGIPWRVAFALQQPYYAGRIMGDGKRVETLGWRPGCDCGDGLLREWGTTDVDALPTDPCTVLDPFLGSGTTAHVARKLGRRSIGIELNESYCQLAARRMQQQSLFAVET